MGVAVGSGAAVGRGVAVGGAGAGAADVNFGTGVTVATGDEAGPGRGTAVTGGVWVSVTAVGVAVLKTAAGASCPRDWVHAAKAIKRTAMSAAEIEQAAGSFMASWPCLPEYGLPCASST